MTRLFVVFFLLVFFWQEQVGAFTVYKIGVLDNKGNVTASFLQWDPTFGTYLNRYLAVFDATFRTETIALSFDDLTDAASSHAVDLAFTNTGHSATFGELYNFQPLMALENFRLGHALSQFGGAAFVHHNSSIQSLEQCAEKKICAVSKSSFGGCVTQLKEMVDRKVPNVPKLFESITFTGSHEQVLYDTNDGLCDCGFVRTDKFEGTQKNFPASVANLRQISPKTSVEYTFFPFKISTKLYPEWLVMSSKTVPVKHQELIQTIMFSIRANHDAAVTGQYSRWFNAPSLDDVMESLFATGQLPRPVPEEPISTVFIVSVSAGGVAIILAVVLVFALRSKRNNSNAPKNAYEEFTIVFTDIQSSTALWAQAPEHMGISLDIHHDLIRAAIAKHNGYEVKTIGDSFMVAFKEPADAICFALFLQLKLFAHEWPPEIDECYKEMERETLEEEGSQVGSVHNDYQQWWNGLRVRVGIHFGQGDIKFDAITQGYDYYGTVVNTAARVEAAGNGGQILITSSLLKRVGLDSIKDAIVTDLGVQNLRGLSEPVGLIQIVPKPLSGRVFGGLRLDKVASLEDNDTQFEVENPSIVTGSTIAGDPEGYVRAHLVAGGEVGSTKSVDLIDEFTYVSGFVKTLFSTTSRDYREKMFQHLMKKWHIQNNSNVSAALVETKVCVRAFQVFRGKTSANARRKSNVSCFTVDEKNSGAELFNARKASQREHDVQPRVVDFAIPDSSSEVS